MFSLSMARRSRAERPVVISTIVLNWNRSGLLERTVTSYLDTVRVPHELIIVDNASSDGSPDVIRRFCDRSSRVSAVYLRRNIGGEAFNKALRGARGCFLHLSENDLEFLPGWSEAVLEKFDAFPELGQLSLFGPVPSDEEVWELKPCGLRHSRGRIIYVTEHNVGTSSVLDRALWDGGLRVHNLPSTTGSFLFPDDGRLSADVRRRGRLVAWSDKYLVRNLGHSAQEIQTHPDYYAENYRTKPIGEETLARRMADWKAQPVPVRESFLLGGTAIAPEKSFPGPECPNPRLWSMLDGNTAEVECLEFLYGLVRLLKPELVLETGTWHGGMAIAIASALRQNGLGRLITFEIDQESCAVASRRLEAAGVKALVELRNESSLEAEVDGPIGLLILDSELSIRGEEFRRFRNSLKPGAIVVFHDTSTTHRVVREQIEALVAEGSLSAILIPSPRGLAVCQVKPI